MQVFDHISKPVPLVISFVSASSIINGLRRDFHLFFGACILN